MGAEEEKALEYEHTLSLTLVRLPYAGRREPSVLEKGEGTPVYERLYCLCVLYMVLYMYGRIRSSCRIVVAYILHTL